MPGGERVNIIHNVPGHMTRRVEGLGGGERVNIIHNVPGHMTRRVESMGVNYCNTNKTITPSNYTPW
jgi:hypothetical protein